MATVSAFYVTGLDRVPVVVIRNDSRQYADVEHEAMDTFNALDVDDYDILCTETGNTGEYYITWPSWLAVGAYTVQFIPRASGTIAESDFSNRFSVSNWYWDGTNLVSDWAVKLAISASPITDSIEKLINAIEAIVAHADYGNAQLVRSTTPANTFDVSATGEGGLDFSNMKAATAPTTLTNITVPTVTTVGTTTTNTDMRGTDGANTTTPPTVAEVDAELTSSHGSGDWRSATGTGDASAANQALILEDIVDMKGTLFAKDTDSMVNLAHTGADSDTLETLSDQIDTWGTGITVSRTTTGTAPVVDIDVGQYEAFSVTITASDAQTGDSHELTAYKASDPKTAVFRYTTANGDITVGGSGDLTITISADNTNMRTARQLQYVLWNTTDSEKISEGVIDIEAHPEPL